MVLGMTDLTPDQVAAMAGAAGLTLDGDDLAEVTHRLNAYLEALVPLADLPLDTVEPTPFGTAPIPFGDAR
jgi:hypothetical protein